MKDVRAGISQGLFAFFGSRGPFINSNEVVSLYFKKSKSLN
jgi:hypothetical protein